MAYVEGAVGKMVKNVSLAKGHSGTVMDKWEERVILKVFLPPELPSSHAYALIQEQFLTIKVSQYITHRS